VNTGFVEIPDGILPIIGEPDPGTRIFRQTGSQNHTAEWFEVISEQFGRLVSPGGVCMFAPVSRAAVHKRLKQGKLSAFCFHPVETKRGLFGSREGVRQIPYCYIPASEAECWRKEIEDRMEKRGDLTRAELEGDRPDWQAGFLEWKHAQRRRGSDGKH
jgi:hypothetical protein